MNRKFTTLASCRFARPLISQMRVMVLVITGFSSLAVSPVQAATYRWVDADGVIHFSQTVPQQLDVRPQALILDDRLMASMPRQPNAALPNRVIHGYCRDIRNSTKAEAERMLGQAALTDRHRRLLTEADDREGARVHKQLINHVLGFRNTQVSADEMATLAMNQCLNGLYQDDIESYVRREHPDQHDEFYR